MFRNGHLETPSVMGFLTARCLARPDGSRDPNLLPAKLHLPPLRDKAVWATWRPEMAVDLPGGLREKFPRIQQFCDVRGGLATNLVDIPESQG